MGSIKGNDLVLPAGPNVYYTDAVMPPGDRLQPSAADHKHLATSSTHLIVLAVLAFADAAAEDARLEALAVLFKAAGLLAVAALGVPHAPHDCSVGIPLRPWQAHHCVRAP